VIKKILLAAAGILVVAPLANSADFPQKNIRLVVPFEPGGAGDTTSRIIVEAANEILDGPKITVVNRSGGGGIVGQTFVSRSRPDGYTILAMTNSVITNPTLKGAGYSIDDFEPIAIYNFDPDVIAVAADSKLGSIADLVAAAGSREPNMVVAGIATAHHMVGLAVEQNTDLAFNYLPVRGFGNQLQTVMGNHADGSFWPLGEAATHALGGSIKILAIAAESRDEGFPDVPTFVESGLGVPVWATFRGWAVPAGTPADVVEFLSELLAKVHQSAVYRDKMAAAGYKPVYQDAAQFRKAIDDYKRLTDSVIEAHGLDK